MMDITAIQITTEEIRSFPTDDVEKTRLLNVCLGLFSEIQGTIFQEQNILPDLENLVKYIHRQHMKLSIQEKAIIKDGVKRNTLEKFDSSLLYKLIRNLSSLREDVKGEKPKQIFEIEIPTKGWGNRNDDIKTAGDALEEMIYLRNKFIHDNGPLDKDDIDEAWKKFNEICSFLDSVYKSDFCEKLRQEKKKEIMDDRSKELLEKAKEECRAAKRRVYVVGATMVVGGGSFIFYQAYTQPTCPKDERRGPPKFTSCEGPKETFTVERGEKIKVDWPDPLAVDANGTTIIPESNGPESGSLFGNGTYINVYVAKDSEGQEKTCPNSFSVKESSIRCEQPPNMDIILQNGNNKEMLEWDIKSLYSTTDIDPPRIEQVKGLPSGSNFTIGTHEVEYRLTDSTGVSVNCSITINVSENGFGDQNHAQEIANITSQKEIIEQRIVLPEVGRQNRTDISATLQQLSPEMSLKYEEWHAKYHSSTPASPFDKWTKANEMPQCRPEDAPRYTTSRDKASPSENWTKANEMPQCRSEEEPLRNVSRENASPSENWTKANEMPQCRPNNAPPRNVSRENGSNAHIDYTTNGGCPVKVIDGKEFERMCQENKGWNEAPLQRRRLHRQRDHWNDRCYDHLDRIPELQRTTEREGNPCNICRVPVEEAFVYKSPTKDILFHGRCIDGFVNFIRFHGT